ncbi:LamG domain-containing protein [Planctomycetales bacterium ZRK34]|nr:LamG domain-containing protein [Planctomycetales bacterium ZRK34]
MNKQAHHRTLAALLAVALAAGTAGAAEELGTLTWNASNNAGESSDTWEAINDATRVFSFGPDAGTGDRPTLSTADPTHLAGIASAYTFDGDNDLATTISDPNIFTNLPGDPSNEPASFEVWFKPTTLTGGNQILFETGGSGDGSSLTISDGQIRWRVKNGTAGLLTVTADLPTTGDFIQVVGTIDTTTATDEAVLYLNGQAATAVTDTFLSATTTNPSGGGSLDNPGAGDWDGGNASGLGSSNSTRGGSSGGDLNGFDTFDGQIAIMRFHEKAMSAAEVLTNYNAVAAPVYATAVLDADPIAYWRLGEREEAVNSATVETGLAGLGAAADGAYSGSPDVIATSLLLTDPNNPAVHFDGVDDRIDIADNGAINTGGPYQTKTFELLFNADSVSSSTPQVLYEQGGQFTGMNLYIDEGELHGGVWNSSNYFDVVASISAQTTYHVAFVWNQGDLELYINGALVDTATAAFTQVGGHTGDIAIGAMNDGSFFDDISGVSGGGYYFAGLIDEVALYNTALDSTTIETHYAAVVPLPAALPGGLALLGAMVLRRRR